MDKSKLKLESRKLNPVIIIGKDGINQGVIDHLKRVIKQKKLVKVKMLRSYIDSESEKGLTKKQIGEKIADLTGSLFVEVMGLTVSLAKK